MELPGKIEDVAFLEAALKSGGNANLITKRFSNTYGKGWFGDETKRDFEERSYEVACDINGVLEQRKVKFIYDKRVPSGKIVVKGESILKDIIRCCPYISDGISKLMVGTPMATRFEVVNVSPNGHDDLQVKYNCPFCRETILHKCGKNKGGENDKKTDSNVNSVGSNPI